jgi:hypothetical protein
MTFSAADAALTTRKLGMAAVKKNNHRDAETQRRLGRARAAPSLCLCASVVRPSYAFARSIIARSSTSQPAASSSCLASSISLWLMPSLQGTKIIEVGVTRDM